MISAFYKPVILNLNNRFQIVYPMKGVEDVLGRDIEKMEEYLMKMGEATGYLKDCEYSIVILWNDGNDIMTDLWIFKGMESIDSGYLIDCRTFRNLKEIHEEGITASDGLMILGKECELEELNRKNGGSIEEYINENREFAIGWETF